LISVVGEVLGELTNNVAEYRALLLGLERARAVGAREVLIRGDSQLVLRQLTGAYKVSKDHLKPLHAQALQALQAFDRWAVEEVPRSENTHADRLVNELLDGARG